MGATHFLIKTLPRVRTEMSLRVLAYNIKRVMRILRTEKLIQAICTFKDVIASSPQIMKLA